MPISIKKQIEFYNFLLDDMVEKLLKSENGSEIALKYANKAGILSKILKLLIDFECIEMEEN